MALRVALDTDVGVICRAPSELDVTVLAAAIDPSEVAISELLLDTPGISTGHKLNLRLTVSQYTSMTYRRICDNKRFDRQSSAAASS